MLILFLNVLNHEDYPYFEHIYVEVLQLRRKAMIFFHTILLKINVCFKNHDKSCIRNF